MKRVLSTAALSLSFFANAGQAEQNAAQSRPIASQAKASAEHHVAQANSSNKETSAKARPEHQGGKNTEQH